MIRVLLDTNILRYYGNRKKDAAQYHLIKAFWDDVQAFPNNYKLCIAEETFEEIVVQLPVIERNAPKVAAELNLLISYLEIIRTPYDVTLEHKMRQVAAYVKTKYSVKMPNGKEMEYPSVSDARILLTAYYDDLRLVTKNIRDFMLFACIDGVLWDPETNTEVIIDEETYLKLKEDSILNDFVEQLSSSKTVQ